jgi:hypothetical protein
MKARLKPWRKASKYSVGYRVVACGKTIGVIARAKSVPFGMRNDWSCDVVRRGRVIARGPSTPRRGEAKRWVLEHYVP